MAVATGRFKVTYTYGDGQYEYILGVYTSQALANTAADAYMAADLLKPADVRKENLTMMIQAVDSLINAANRL